MYDTVEYDHGCCPDGTVLCAGVCCNTGTKCNFNGVCTKTCAPSCVDRSLLNCGRPQCVMKGHRLCWRKP